VDLLSRKAKFHDVVKNEEALVYHAVKYQSGNRYPLAVMCFQHLQHKARLRK
jgi:hypothetical protein